MIKIKNLGEEAAWCTKAAGQSHLNCRHPEPLNADCNLDDFLQTEKYHATLIGTENQKLP